MEFALPIVVVGTLIYLVCSVPKTSEGTSLCYPTCKAMPVTVIDQIKDSLDHPPGGFPFPLNKYWWEMTQCDYAQNRISARLEFVDSVDRRERLRSFGLNMGAKAVVKTMALIWEINEQPDGSAVKLIWRTSESDRVQCDYIASIMQRMTEEMIQRLNAALSAASTTPTSTAGGSLLKTMLGAPAASAVFMKYRSQARNSAQHAVHSQQGARVKSWPSPQDFNESIQSPQVAFEDAMLRTGEVELNMMGMPKVASGAFASVYKLSCADRDWAIRCFLSPVRDSEYRYRQLSKYICSDKLNCTVDFDYVSRGIRVGEELYPILRMEWVEGTPFNFYVEDILKRGESLTPIINEFREMMEALHYAGIAHGDLQHGNILVRDSKLVLVDYDGMFVPSLSMEASNELGHPNYQHPARNKDHFGAYLDNFSACLIDVSLVALQHMPELWNQFNGGDECLLLRRRDLIAPQKSDVIAALEGSEHRIVREKVERFRGFLDQADLSSVPALAADGSELPPVHSVVSQIKDGEPGLLPDWLKTSDQ